MPRIDATATAAAWVKFGENRPGRDATGFSSGTTTLPDVRPTTAQLAVPLDTISSALTLSTEKV